jgi:prepilin-type N-terminal cleavage/methylation domain-containing protein/prepilin-type processing-associated H-X9-DG protein
MRRAFTLIEILVVLVILAILTAILFPVFARAKSAAWKTACLSNTRQLGFAQLMYQDDNDERFVPMLTSIYGAPYQDLRDLWYSKLAPYVKSGQVSAGADSGNYAGSLFRCHEDGSNTARLNLLNVSYGFNYFYLSNRAAPGTDDAALSPPLAEGALAEPADTVLFGESFGYIAKVSPPYFDTWWDGVSLTNPQTSKDPTNYWERPQRHDGTANYTFTDGHARSQPQPLIYPVSADGSAECIATHRFFRAYPGEPDEAWAGCQGFP